MQVLIHHNPACSKSRDVLRVIEAARHDVTVVEYLKTGWTRPQLLALFTVAGLSPRQALRTARGTAAELGLLDEGATDDAILAAMVAHPELVERPIVCTARGVRLCRPVGRVLELLDTWPAAPFALKNGTVLIDADGQPVAGV